LRFGILETVETPGNRAFARRRTGCPGPPRWTPKPGEDTSRCDRLTARSWPARSVILCTKRLCRGFRI